MTVAPSLHVYPAQVKNIMDQKKSKDATIPKMLESADVLGVKNSS